MTDFDFQKWLNYLKVFTEPGMPSGWIMDQSDIEELVDYIETLPAKVQINKIMEIVNDAEKEMTQTYQRQKDKILELKSENQRLRRALEFYADPKNWKNTHAKWDAGYYWSRAASDYGYVAYHALEGRE